MTFLIKYNLLALFYVLENLHDVCMYAEKMILEIKL